jgi:hypothetical protein
MMEAARTSETSVYFNETIRRNITEGCNIHSPPREPEISQNGDVFGPMCVWIFYLLMATQHIILFMKGILNRSVGTVPPHRHLLGDIWPQVV